jgi:putative transposase
MLSGCVQGRQLNSSLDRFAVVDAYDRHAEQRRDYRNGYYERDFVTVLGTLRLRIARTRGQSFLLEAFQRRRRKYRC